MQAVGKRIKLVVMLRIVLRQLIPSTALYDSSRLNAIIRSKQYDDALQLYQSYRSQGHNDKKLFSQGIQIYLKQSQFDKAWDTLKEYRMNFGFPDTVLYTQLIQAAAMQQSAEKALSLFNEMETNGFEITERTYSALMQAVANRKDYAIQIFDIMDRMKANGIELTPFSYINIVGACGKLNDMEKAKKYWNIIINEKHSCHNQLYLKMMWAYYFKISTLLNLMDLNKRKTLVDALVPSENIQALIFTKLDTIDISELLSEAYTLRSQFQASLPYTKILCMIDTHEAIKSVDKMNERALCEIIRSCALFGHTQLAIDLYSEHGVHNNLLKQKLISTLARNGYLEESFELLAKIEKPRFKAFQAVYHACKDNSELLRVYIEFFNHPLDTRLKQAMKKQILELEK